MKVQVVCKVTTSFFQKFKCKKKIICPKNNGF